MVRETLLLTLALFFALAVIGSGGFEIISVARASHDVHVVGVACDVVGSPVNVDILDSPNPGSFDPYGVSVQIGQIVHWVNDGNFHTTTHVAAGPFDPTLWDSGVLLNGQHFDVQFCLDVDEDTTLFYECKIHAFTGKVLVDAP